MKDGTDFEPLVPMSVKRLTKNDSTKAERIHSVTGQIMQTVDTKRHFQKLAKRSVYE